MTLQRSFDAGSAERAKAGGVIQLGKIIFLFIFFKKKGREWIAEGTSGSTGWNMLANATFFYNVPETYSEASAFPPEKCFISIWL